MPKKPEKSKPSEKKAVHFIFRAHSDGEKYMHKIPQVDTFIFEHPNGHSAQEPITQEWIRKQYRKTYYNRTARKFLSKLLEEGKTVKAGETYHSVERKKHFEMLKIMMNIAMAVAFRSGELKDIKNYFVKRAKSDRERHELIKNTIRESLPKKIAARFGSVHSILSKELGKEGIQSTRDLGTVTFNWHDIVLRKLLSGIDPDKISNIEYIKGFLAMLHSAEYKLIFAKPSSKLTAEDINFLNLVQTTMLDRCTDKQIVQIFESAKPFARYPFSGKIHKLLCKYNGLPTNPTREQLEAFLEKHSEQWRRMQRAKARQAEKRIPKKTK